MRVCEYPEKNIGLVLKVIKKVKSQTTL